MGKTASKKKGPVGASDGADAAALAAPSTAEPAEPLERARLQAEVARQRVRIAKEELKRARKRVKEAKREAKRARKQAYAARKVWKKARKAHRAKGTPGRKRARTDPAQTAKGPHPRSRRGKRKSTHRPAPARRPDGSAPVTPSSET
ncbi:MAG TPA: hypothetical protein VGG63_19350 [Steroidobacteraceae bacterium]|jgi:hypothetical protein